MIPRPSHRSVPFPGGLALGLCVALAAGSASVRADEPVLRLEARGAFDTPTARVGDTVAYRLRVEWNEVPAAVMLLTREDLEIPGMTAAGTSTRHSKTAAGGLLTSAAEFTYRFVAREPGTARVEPFRFRYHNGLTGREEDVPVTGATLEITPVPATLARRFAGVAAGGLLLLGAAACVLLLARRRTLAARNGAPAAETAALESLRRRCRDREDVDAAAWTADAERLCTRHLCRRLGIANPANVRFEAALDRYLDRRPAPPPDEAFAWSTLRGFFHDARLAARRDARDLREACRHLETCLQNQGEPPP